MTEHRDKPFTPIVLLALAMLLPAPARGHCDGWDGPVVRAAQKALAGGDVSLVLIWVRKDDEAEIRTAFERASSVRKLGAQARELADTYFFETLVRIHRAGEGVPFTGLKPAGRDLGPAIPAADRALESGDVAALTHLLVERTRAGVLARFQRARAASTFAAGDIGAGREYVGEYVEFVHFVEGIHDAATRPGEGHHAGAAEASHEAK